MGIPSYFSYIIRNHSQIVKPIQKFSLTIHYLLMDCNSIVYDEFHKMAKQDGLFVDFEQTLIENVILKIEKYVKQLRPTISVFISFDGVAPFAKMGQQRTRRFKSWFLENTRLSKTASPHFQSISITSGTPFMQKLSSMVERHFSNRNNHNNKSPVEPIVSSSNIPGEGEHKMFHYLRNIPKNHLKNANVLVYGLDADLIMLSLFHTPLCKDIYIVREKPEFGLDINNHTKPPVAPLPKDPELCMLGMTGLSNSILKEMRMASTERFRIDDYIFLCFFLGNDFLPQFPSVNLRTMGIQLLMDVYRECVGVDPAFQLVARGSIQWQHVSTLVLKLAQQEREWMQQEIHYREQKWGNMRWREETEKEKEDLVTNIPVIYRHVEKYICPTEVGWETRYYRSLCGGASPTAVAREYCRGLEWVFKYYHSECVDWKWSFPYNYAPLWKDLAKELPTLNRPLFSSSVMTTPFSMNAQLLYVLPPPLHREYMNAGVVEAVHAKYPEFFPVEPKCKFQWAFKRYFWESHLEEHAIPCEVLETMTE